MLPEVDMKMKFFDRVMSWLHLTSFITSTSAGTGKGQSANKEQSDGKFLHGT